MNDETKDPMCKRIWVAQPTRKGRYARYIVRSVPEMNVSADHNLMRPSENLGWSHQEFQLYHHQSTIDGLKKEIKQAVDNAVLEERNHFLKMVDECGGDLNFLKSKVKIQITIRNKEMEQSL